MLVNLKVKQNTFPFYRGGGGGREEEKKCPKKHRISSTSEGQSSEWPKSCFPNLG